MSNDRRMNLIVADYERLGCPDLPEGITPKDQRREWFTAPPHFASGSSPDDIDMNDVTEEQHEEMGQTLFVDDTNGFDKNKFVPIEPRGTLERQDLNSLTMGPRSQNRKKNTRQVRERDATIVKAAAARKKKDLLQSKLFAKETGFNRFKNCRMCISYVLRKKHPKLNIRQVRNGQMSDGLFRRKRCDPFQCQPVCSHHVHKLEVLSPVSHGAKKA